MPALFAWIRVGARGRGWPVQGARIGVWNGTSRAVILDAEEPRELRLPWRRANPPVELFYDPEDLDPGAPRLHVRKNGGAWELRDGTGVLLGAHGSLPEAIDAAEARSRVRFHEILVRGAVSSMEWSVRQNPEMVELARALIGTAAVHREAAD